MFLFDIGGILVKDGAVPFDYWRAVVQKHFSLQASRNDIPTSGKPDRQILAELLKLHGIQDPEGDPRFLPALGDVGRIVKDGLRGVRLAPIENVESLVSRLLEERHCVGLLTGNTYEKARVKLENAGLWKYFAFGAFGDQASVRSVLVSVAMRAAAQRLGTPFSSSDVYLVGDTVRDIRCAREAGVKIIAVATGADSFSELAREKPDFIFRDFKDPALIVESVLREKPRPMAAAILSRSTRTCSPAGRFA